MKKAHVIAHCIWIVFAFAVAAESGRLGFGTFVRPGPGFVPFLAGLLLGGLAVIGLVQAAAGKSLAGAEAGFRAADLLRICLVVGVLFVYVFLWDVIGFPASTFLLLLFLFRCVEPLRWRSVFIAAAITLVFVYLLFSIVLGARLPSGRLWTYFTS
jgi:putative tricarboxylic transport membrane protein